MLDVRTAGTATQPTSPATNSATLEEETVWIKIMSQNLDGVMFHSYERDLFDLLKLKGFRKMHCHQVCEENEELDKVKDKYMKVYKKLPILTATRKNLWKEHEGFSSDGISGEEIGKLVKESMHAYADWESEVLDNLLTWKRNTKDRKLVHKMIVDVMEELEFVEAIINVLEECDYSYDRVCEMSDYLEAKF
jgi:hypothetical protein